MKKILIILLLAVMSINCVAQSKNYAVQGKEYSSTKKTKSKSEPKNTGYTWKDSKGNVYPIYMSESGSCYVIKTSSKTGKEYKNYLGPEVSQDICNKLGVTYKGKKSK